MIRFVPESFEVPEKVQIDDLILRKMRADDAEIDFAAVMSSMDTIKMLRGGTWPTPGLTMEEDWIDLAWHQREFENRSSFAYILTSPDGKKSVGCVYFYPPGHPMNSAAGTTPEDADVVINMWVTTEAFQQGLYSSLMQFVQEWVSKEWPFQNPYFSNLIKT